MARKHEAHGNPEHWGDHGIGAPIPSDDSVDESPRSPNYALWLYYLYFRPVKFFREFVVEHLWFTTAVAALLYGMSGAIGRLHSSMMRGSVSSRTQWAFQSWGTYFTVAITAGIFGACIYFLLGGWWYRVRLLWSGAENPDRTLARRVYVYASTVHALPVVLSAVWEATQYASPTAAFNAPAMVWSYVLMIMPFWSTIVSYIGVRTVFKVRGFRPTLWFLILPMLVYIVAYVGVMNFAQRTTTASPPQVTRPARFHDAGVSFLMPGDWSVDTKDPEYVAGESIEITMPQDGHMSIWVMDTDESTESVLESLKHAAMDSEETMHFSSNIHSWGVRQGSGVNGTYTVDGDRCLIRYFVYTVPDGRTVVVSTFASSTASTQLQGSFDLVASTLKVEPRAEEPQNYSEMGISFDLPRGWGVESDESDVPLSRRVELDIPDRALMTIWILDTDETLSEIITAHVGSMRDSLPASVTFGDPINSWASHVGHGIEGTYAFDDTAFVTRIFAYQLMGGKVLVIQTSCDSTEQHAMNPKFEHVASSIKVEPMTTETSEPASE